MSRAPIYVAVVDDDQSVRRSYARLLRAAGVEAITYDSGEALLADAKRPRFDCMVLDVQLGGMSGIELALLLSRAGDRVPVIFVTAYDSPDARAAAQATGCVGYFPKTDSGDDVLETIMRLTV